MSAKEWRKFVFLDEKKFSLDGLDGFQTYWLVKKYPEENYSTRHSEGGSLMIWGRASHLLENINYNFSVVDKVLQIMDDTKWFISRTRRTSSMWRRMSFSAFIHNALISMKYLLEQKIKLLDHPKCSPDLSHIENLWVLTEAKVYEGGRQKAAISDLISAILVVWEKYLRKLVDSMQSSRWIYKILNKKISLYIL